MTRRASSHDGVPDSDRRSPRPSQAQAHAAACLECVAWPGQERAGRRPPRSAEQARAPPPACRSSWRRRAGWPAPYASGFRYRAENSVGLCARARDARVLVCVCVCLCLCLCVPVFVSVRMCVCLCLCWWVVGARTHACMSMPLRKLTAAELPGCMCVCVCVRARVYACVLMYFACAPVTCLYGSK